MNSTRAHREIEHGRVLAGSDPESVWGWGGKAGRARAARRAGMIAKAAGLAPGIRALEIGCGTGLFTAMFAASGAQLLAVDISGDLLERARAQGLPPDRVQFLQTRFEECGSAVPYDAIIGNSILHHLDLQTALPRIRALLKPGGVFSFAEPNMLNPQIAVQKNIPWVKRLMGDSPDESAFVRWRFRESLIRAGFEDIRITPFDWLHPATPPKLISIVSRLGLFLERVPALREFAGSLLIQGRRASKRSNLA